MPVRGIRGAVVAFQDQPDAIHSAARDLLLGIMHENEGLKPEDIASVLFTVTDDLHSAFPATAARQIGWDMVPLMDAREIAVPNSLERVIRVLILWNTDLRQSEIQHVYLGAAAQLRPDIKFHQKDQD
jgi:chorismate mutase